jgi:hypothetical protein
MRRSGPDLDQDERLEEARELETNSDVNSSISGIDYDEATLQFGLDNDVELSLTEGGPAPENDPVSSNPREMAVHQRENRADDTGSKVSTESTSSGSSAELHDFLQWVLGPSGIPSLRLLAYGDFSYNRRYDIECYLFCRNEQSANFDEEWHSNRAQFYREVTDGDQDLLDLLKEHENLITACPTDSLFDQRYAP